MDLRAVRTAQGLSQGELAERAQVSRSLVAAVESGRNTPAVDAALRLAAALGCSVERLFSPAESEAVVAIGGALRDGQPVRLGQVGERLIATPSRVGTRVDGVWRGGTVERLGTCCDLVVMGCEPSLGLAERLLPGMLWIQASSAAAEQGLADGLAHAAVTHGTFRADGVHVARWRVGVATTGDLGHSALDEIAARQLPVVQREPGAASQGALQRRLGNVPGPVTDSHHDAAVLASLVGAGVTIEPVALEHGLSFHELETHDVALLGQAERLAELMTGTYFRSQLRARPGYDVD